MIMSGIGEPKFLQGQKLNKGYYDAPNPYENAPSCHVDLLALTRYAKGQGKRLVELTAEEIAQFKI